MSGQDDTLLQEGENYKGFEVLKIIPISELQSSLYELVHISTGAQVMHIANDDKENVFCLAFRTLPDSSNGVAHILEHTVLCGSEKYPVKDPFFAMNRRSLNTYMNALTGSDFTCYPAASQVPKDFYNLLEVYLDAVFKAQLKETSFLQEGHRLEFTVPDDPATPLVHRGIVFNEMKGSMASPEARMWKSLMHYLFPDTPYGFNSGGDPQVIPQLTYRQLLDFYRFYYHPGHCLFYFYGNLPLKQHLDFLDKHVFQDISRISPIAPIPKQPRFLKPKEARVPYPIASSEYDSEKAMIAFGWLTCHIQEQQDAMALQILDLILTGTDAAPLKHALLRSGLCKQAEAFVDTDVNELPFVLVCKGCRLENKEALSEVLFSTLNTIAQEGIPHHLIEAAIHQHEFSRSEIGGGHAPFGLSLFMRAGLLKQHGIPPEEGLRMHTLFESLRYCTEDPAYLTGLIKKYLIENPHRVDLILEPSTTLEEKEQEEEKRGLEKIQSTLTPDEAKRIINKTKELELAQEEQEKEDINVLPKVTLQDVDKQPKDFLLSMDDYNGLQVYHHDCFTNKILYADLLFELPDLTEEELPLLRLLSGLLPEIGNGERNYQHTLEYIQQHTGGVGCSLFLHLQASDYHSFKPAFGLRGKALYRKIDKLFPLLKDMISSPNFSDVERIRELLHQHQTSLENSLTHGALKYASGISGANISVASQISNRWYGLEYIWFIRHIVKGFEIDPSILIEQLKSLKEKIFGLTSAHLVLGCDETSVSLLKNEGFYGLSQMGEKPFSPWTGHYPMQKFHSQGRIISSPVAFTSMSIPALPYIHPNAPALSIASHVFENKILHKRIREQGGAYGAGASNNPSSGQFSFYSYRDPHIASTVQTFKEALEKIAGGQLDDRDLEEAKLGILQGLDSPVAPGSRALLAYSWMLAGKTKAVREAYRERLLGLTVSDIQNAVKEHLITKLDESIVVSFAGESLLQKENHALSLVGEEPLPILPI